MAASSSSSASGNKRRATDDESSLSSSKRQNLSSTASASGGNSRWKYDVFLSFRGEDTRNNITDHLYAALDRNGIITFKDDERLERGTEISSELTKAIEESRFSIVIFSKDYASSTWCLEELAKIVEFMERNNNQTVIPVFYNVDPSDVRKQNGEFKNAFDKHQQNPKIDSDKIQRWRAALERAANIVGDFVSAGREGLVPQSDQGRNAEQGKGLDSSVNEPYGPWMQVTYGRNARYFGSGTAGKRGNFQSQGGKNGSGMKYGNGPLSQEQHGVDMAGSNEGNNVGVSKVSVGIDKKKIGNKPKNGSRFSVLNEELLEEISVKPSHNDTNRQGKNQSKKVLSEISNRKPPNRNQVSKSSSSYLVENNVNNSYFCKPLKENSSEVLSKRDGKGHIKDSRLLSNDSCHGMEEVIEDSVVLQSLHSEIMDLENSVGREGIKVGEVSSTVEKVILSEASNIEEVASKLKEAMDIALV
ncbi:hypothetical protein LWI29_000092 [Acer saccharum]|uniref:ADP-ribosyl cyclase/cyclic ADP-ribose hydrolase n=1 Tax=Acer saccharum TaxID=4024 RepID=A0AA39S5S9_ACESA|nr:hypothetical protein LWI29_000092 [Acer saccharum]